MRYTNPSQTENVGSSPGNILGSDLLAACPGTSQVPRLAAAIGRGGRLTQAGPPLEVPSGRTRWGCSGRGAAEHKDSPQCHKWPSRGMREFFPGGHPAGSRPRQLLAR